MIGSRLAHYEITSHLGTGGMGEVYQAADSKLGRSVAIKFLPEAFAHDAERVARFQREARVLAQLNHPNIAAIHGLEESGGRHFLVMELVPGETLAERIHRGPVPVDEALIIAKQIAEALDSAHEKGVIHRDLKPANIKITPEGVVKVLDFGLAKAYEAEASSVNLTNSPTISQMATQQGIILGTAAYMSPEQARGKPVDRRADIWAFGIVFYEMVTGKQLFGGETVSDTLAAVLEREVRIDAAPARVRPLLKRCLERDPRKRLRDIGDAWQLLEPGQGTSAPPAAMTRRWWLLTAAFALALVASLVPTSLYFFKAPVEAPEMRFESPAAGTDIPVVSPDGQRIAYVAPQDGKGVIWMRPIGSLTAKPLAGTENVESISLFWSQDSHNIAFIAESKLKKIDLTSGVVQTLYDGTVITVAGAWNAAGDVLFSSISNEGPVLMRISSSGGTPIPVTTPLKRGEGIVVLPQFLPDGRHFLYHKIPAPGATGTVFVGSLDSKSATRLMEIPNLGPEGNSFVRYVSPGYLVFSRNRTLLAQAFNPERQATSGETMPIAENVIAFSASDNGTLVYRAPGTAPNGTAATGGGQRLLWMNRSGKPAGEVPTPGSVGSVELSRDGQRIAIDTTTQTKSEVWVIDPRGVPQRISNSSGFAAYPVWEPDGSHIVYSGSLIAGPSNLIQRASNAVGNEQPLFSSPDVGLVRDWSSDGKYIVFDSLKVGNVNKSDMWILPMSGDKKPFAFLETPFRETQAQISPDGQYIAYATNDSGRYQIVVSAFPDPTKGKWPITSAGGVEPRWRRKDGAELYYLSPAGKIMVVAITRGSTFVPGIPMELFTAPPLFLQLNPISRRYDLTADGQRFLFAALYAASAEPQASQPIITIVNWTRALKK